MLITSQPRSMETSKPLNQIHNYGKRRKKKEGELIDNNHTMKPSPQRMRSTNGID